MQGVACLPIKMDYSFGTIITRIVYTTEHVDEYRMKLQHSDSDINLTVTLT